MRIVHFNCGAPDDAMLPFQYQLHEAGHEVLPIDPVAIFKRFDTAEARIRNIPEKRPHVGPLLDRLVRELGIKSA